MALALSIIDALSYLWFAGFVIGSAYIFADTRASMADPYAYQIFPTLPGYKRWLFWRDVTLVAIATSFVLWIISLCI